MNDDTNPSCNSDKNYRTFSTATYQEVKTKASVDQIKRYVQNQSICADCFGTYFTLGVRNVYLGSGLGGMKPNITVLGFYDFKSMGLHYLYYLVMIATKVCRTITH